MQHIKIVKTNSSHMVLSVPNTQVLANVLDTFKQGSGIAFATYKKPKDFRERGNGNYHLNTRPHA